MKKLLGLKIIINAHKKIYAVIETALFYLFILFFKKIIGFTERVCDGHVLWW